MCRYIAQPVVSNERLSLTSRGKCVTRLRGRGTSQMFFEPLHFMARLAALMPKPRVNLARFHGVFAPHSRFRAQVTLAKRGHRDERADTVV